MAEIDADGETDAEDAPEVDTRADAYDESESQDRTDDETEPHDEPEPETEIYDEFTLEGRPELETEDAPELEEDSQAEPALELHEEPDTQLTAATAATASEPETLDLHDEVDLRDAPAEVAEGRPFLDAGVYEERWNAIQTSFVDEPRQAVQSADRMISEAMEDLAKTLTSHRDSLQAQWRQGDDVDTERLRVVFQGYRAFLGGMST